MGIKKLLLVLGVVFGVFVFAVSEEFEITLGNFTAFCRLDKPVDPPVDKFIPGEVTWHKLPSLWTKELASNPPRSSDEKAILSRFYVPPKNPNGSSIPGTTHKPRGFTVSKTAWSMPIYHSTSSDPLVQVTVTLTPKSGSYIPMIEAAGGSVANGTIPVRIPAGAVPAGNAVACSGKYRDGHMAICDLEKEKCWDFFRATHCGNKWTASRILIRDLNESGVKKYPSATRACAGSPGYMGLITKLGMKKAISEGNRSLAYALMIAHEGPMNARHASKDPCGGGSIAGDPRSPDSQGRMGQSFQLDPSIDCSKLGCDDAAEVVCRTLQKRGGILVDSAEPNSPLIVYAEVLNGADNWDSKVNKDGSGFSGNSLKCFKADKLRAIER